MSSVPLQTDVSLSLETSQIGKSPLKFSSKLPKNAIRNSLRASTLDAVLGTVFGVTTSGILLSNFLVELDASPLIFGMLSSIPMLVNLIQPLGAYLSERTTSRFQYSLWTFGISRLLWLILAIGILAVRWGAVTSQQLVILTFVIVLLSHLLGGLGSASWLSWLAMIVPRRLRGRYFGIRNSAASLTNLVYVPLAGLAVSHWYGGTLQGYGVVLFVGIIFGLIALGCQYFKVDVNPQSPDPYFVKLLKISDVQIASKNSALKKDDSLSLVPQVTNRIWRNFNFLMFLVYFSLLMLAVNLSAPFFNFYMLEMLNLDVSWVTVYSSLQAGANLLMLIVWGKLADKIGNRPILILMGIVVALTPLLWLGIRVNYLGIWLWLPLLHIFTGGTGAAIDLCINNMVLGITPVRSQSIYFAIVAAVAGVSGAFGTTIGGLVLQFAANGGLVGLFALSCLLRLLALVPLIFVQEQRL